MQLCRLLDLLVADVRVYLRRRKLLVAEDLLQRQNADAALLIQQRSGGVAELMRMSQLFALAQKQF